MGRLVINGQAGASHIYNHEWSSPSNFTQIGIISASEIDQITNGLMIAGCAGPAEQVHPGL